jgi:hypothetical protein
MAQLYWDQKQAVAWVRKHQPSILPRRYLGEWKESGQIKATSEEKHDGATACFTVAGIYGGTLVLSIVGLIYHSSR